jgi:thiosulfate dehydrogenase [quinone] large subunit
MDVVSPKSSTITSPTAQMPMSVAPENTLPAGRFARVVVLGARIAIALLWIENVNWKSPPDFGRHNGSGLFRYTQDAITHPVFPPFGWAVQHLILPNFIAFGYATMAIEFLLGAFLLSGFLTRFWSVVGLLQITGITLSALNAPHEWHWSYYLMVVGQFVVLAFAAGRVAGVDGLLRPRWSASHHRAARVALWLS